MSEGKRIAKNTIFLYIRMLFVMGVSLFTSRIVLQSLGVVDYGLYNVVGGVVVLLSFLNSSAGGATSRFLTFSLGKKDDYEFDYRSIFSVALAIHAVIALVIVLFCETGGLWYVCNKMVIPDERRTAAIWVFHISIASSFVSFLQVPYNASIIAHEKMNVYAFVGIYEALAKLAIAYVIKFSSLDNLIFYAILLFVQTASVNVFYRFFCLRKFGDKCRFSFVRDKKLYRTLLGYSGWDLIGNFGGVAKSQGVNLILNLFFGPAINAARAVASQVENALYSFTSNFQTAIRPSIIKHYAAGEMDKMLNLFYITCRFSCLLFSCLAIPFIFECEYIVGIWLVNPPEMTVIFIRIVLVTYLFVCLNTSIGIGVHATGDVKRLNLYTLPKPFLELIIIYVLLKLGFPAESALYVLMISSAAVTFVNLVVLKKNIPEVSILKFYLRIILGTFALMLIPSAMAYMVSLLHMKHEFLKLICVYGIYVLLLIPIVYRFGINEEIRVMMIKWLKEKFGNAGNH